MKYRKVFNRYKTTAGGRVLEFVDIQRIIGKRGKVGKAKTREHFASFLRRGRKIFGSKFAK